MNNSRGTATSAIWNVTRLAHQETHHVIGLRLGPTLFAAPNRPQREQHNDGLADHGLSTLVPYSGHTPLTLPVRL